MRWILVHVVILLNKHQVAHSRVGFDLDQPLDPFHSIQPVITTENDKCLTTGRSQQSAKKEETRTKTRRSAKTLHTMELGFQEELGWVIHHILEVHITICASTCLIPFLALNDHHEKLLLSYHFCT